MLTTEGMLVVGLEVELPPHSLSSVAGSHFVRVVAHDGAVRAPGAALGAPTGLEVFPGLARHGHGKAAHVLGDRLHVEVQRPDVVA